MYIYVFIYYRKIVLIWCLTKLTIVVVDCIFSEMILNWLTSWSLPISFCDIKEWLTWAWIFVNSLSLYTYWFYLLSRLNICCLRIFHFFKLTPVCLLVREDWFKMRKYKGYFIIKANLKPTILYTPCYQAQHSKASWPQAPSLLVGLNLRTNWWCSMKPQPRLGNIVQ